PTILPFCHHHLWSHLRVQAQFPWIVPILSLSHILSRSCWTPGPGMPSKNNLKQGLAFPIKWNGGICHQSPRLLRRNRGLFPTGRSQQLCEGLLRCSRPLPVSIAPVGLRLIRSCGPAALDQPLSLC